MVQDNLFSNLENNNNNAIDNSVSDSSENNIAYSDMKFIKGFNWAIPLSYNDAIASCKFEEGDIFYDTPKAYKQWDSALNAIKYSIQIKSIEEDEEDEKDEIEVKSISIFEKNWSSKIKVEITTYTQNFHKNRIITTQGRLFSFLWHGNFEILETISNEPELPILIDEAKNFLVHSNPNYNKKNEKQFIDDLNNTILSYFNLSDFTVDKIEKPNLFIMFYDPTNDTTASKFRAIKSSLSSDFSVDVHELLPKECNLPNADKLFPTITLKCIAINSGKSETIRDVIKEVLWPKKDSQKALRKVDYILEKGKRTSVRSFNLSRHGIFYSYKYKETNVTDIKTHSFMQQNLPYRYRLAINKTDQLPKSLDNLSGFLNRLFTDCPNHLFVDSNFRASGIDKEIDVHITHNTEHTLISFAKESQSFKHYKSRHENLEKYMLDNDPNTIACEIPVWIEAGEFKDYYEVFHTEKALTGHIDILRYEENGKIGVWDYKPKAKKEKKAKTQVFLYAFMLAVRTGRKLEDFVCGYFDEADVFVINPSDVNNF